MRPSPEVESMAFALTAIESAIINSQGAGSESYGGASRQMLSQEIREHVVDLLRGGNAHLSFEQAVSGLPADLRGAKVAGLPHTPWRIIEHMRIAQWDILEFSRNEHHVSPVFPDGYWPDGDAPLDCRAWETTLEAFRSDLQAMLDLVANPSIDLFASISHGDGQTILREALLVADHNAYHLGQLVLLRRCLNAWPVDE